MIEKTIKVPDDTHAIKIERNSNRVVVMVAGKVVADSCRALTLHEDGQPPVCFIPRRDVYTEALERSPTASYCPYKGEASHFHVTEGGTRLVDAAWTYRSPYWAVAEIENHLAFDPDRVEIAAAQSPDRKDLGVWI